MKILLYCAITIVLFIVACFAQPQETDSCATKISHQLQATLSHHHLEEKIRIIATVNDTSGLSFDFPALRIANARIALGHLTKAEILSLCRRSNVLRIDIPKTLYPNIKPEDE